MITIAGALVPTFLLLLMGWGARWRRLLEDGFWPPAERLIYYVLLPALLVTNLAEAPLTGLPVAALAAAGTLAVVAMALLALAARPVLARRPFRCDGAAFTSVFQGLVRPNTYVGMAVVAALFGAEGVTLLAILIATVVPLVNLMSVAVLIGHVRPKDGQPARWRAVAGPIVKNPLILACVGGAALNLGGVGLPPVIGPTLKILGLASLPLGLLAVGAGLDFAALRRGGAAVMVATLGKLALVPLFAVLAAKALGLSGMHVAAAAIYSGLPCAPASYVLARQMGGDAPLAAGIITAQTLLAAISLPLLVALVAG